MTVELPQWLVGACVAMLSHVYVKLHHLHARHGIDKSDPPGWPTIIAEIVNLILAVGVGFYGWFLVIQAINEAKP